MKCKCIHCDEIYEIERGACPACNKRGGYIQEPKCKQIGGLSTHIEDTLQHIESKNEYQIKEIQANGLICILTASPLIAENARKGLRVYVSNTTINEYKRK